MKYGELIKRLGLRPIKDKETHAKALSVVSELMSKGDQSLCQDELDYVVVLAQMIHAYEENVVEPFSASSSDALRHLMETNNLKPRDLQHLIPQERMLGILSGDTSSSPKISETEAAALAEYFKVNPKLFLSN